MRAANRNRRHALVAGDGPTIRDAASYPVMTADASEVLMFEIAA